MTMTTALQIAIVLLIGFVALPTEGVNITADFWTAQDGKITPASLSAVVGDSIVWNPTNGEPQNGVYFHPSGNCSQLDRVAIHRGVDGLARYTFTDKDAGKTMFFASDNKGECEAGQHLSVLVLPEQKESRKLQSLTEKPTLTAGNLTSSPIDTLPTTLPTPQPVSEPVSPSPVSFNIQQTSAPTVVNLTLQTPNPTPLQTPPPTNIPTLPTPLPTPNTTPPPTPNTTPPPTPNPTIPQTSNPTPRPTPNPTPLPTPSQTSKPTQRPTPNPTFLPTLSPTLSPTPKPTAPPTAGQTPSPTRRPTPSPTPAPTRPSTLAPTPGPTAKPSPTPKPNPIPTAAPTLAPVIPPSPSPTASPTQVPVAFAVEPAPTNRPINPATPEPTRATPSPTKSPVSTRSPTDPPTKNPTDAPTDSPTKNPTDPPTQEPTQEPTEDPTRKPTPFPTPFPTLKPVTSAPTFAPSASMGPSWAPSKRPVWTLALGTGEKPSSDGGESTPPPTESETSTVTGTIKFTVLVAGGNRDQIPFESYSSQLISIVDMLALEVADELETPSENEMNRQRHKQRNLMHNQVDSATFGEDQKRLLQQLAVDTPASIVNVQRVGFTASPDLSDSNVFLGGACPASLGSTDGDRCEEITASIDLFVDAQYNVDEMHKVFQQELEKGVSRGRLQYFLNEKYPRSILTIASGQRLESPDSASTQTVSNESTEVAPGAITGIVLAIASGGLLTVLLLFVTRRRQVKSNWKDDSIDVTVERASIDGKTLPEVTGLEWGPPEDIQYEGSQYNEDIDDWSTPSNVSGKPTIVVLPTEHVDNYPQPLDDNFSTASVDDRKDTQSIAESVTSGMHPGDRSAVSEKTGQCSSLGSVSSTGFMSGNQVVDLHEGRLRDYTPGIADFDDLEAAIISGDWAAVGATAAALAGQHDGSVSERQTVASWDEESRDMSTRSKTWQDVIDATKAAELDHLIEQGNWAAIIEVAAKYEWETKEGHDTDHGDL